MNSKAEELLKVYLEWLNEWTKYSDQDGKECLLTRENYDEWDDPPRILLDETIFPGQFYSRHYMVLLCNPYHDEGGPTILTGIWMPDYDDDTWILDEVMQEFDTQIQSIYHNRKMTGLPPGRDQNS